MNAGKRWDDIADTYENRGRQLRQLADACTDDANRYRRAAQDAREGLAERLLLERWAELQARATVSVPQGESAGQSLRSNNSASCTLTVNQGQCTMSLSKCVTRASLPCRYKGVQMEPIGVYYCAVHCGIVNEDEWNCDMVEPGTDCEIRPAYFDPAEAMEVRGVS